jgi:hypothetical protein
MVRAHVAYTISKYGMSLCVLGMAEEFREAGVGGERPLAADRHRHRRRAEPVGRRGGDAPLPEARDHGRRRPCDPHPRQPRCTGNFFIDDEVLAAEGVADLDETKVRQHTVMPRLLTERSEAEHRVAGPPDEIAISQEQRACRFQAFWPLAETEREANADR